MKMRVTIEEYIPEEELPFIDIKDGRLWFDSFYDPKRKMYFYVIKEPDWLKFEFYKTYKIRFVDEDDCDSETYLYRLAARLVNNTLIISEYYNNRWYFINNKKCILDDVKQIDLFEYIDKYSPNISWTDPSLKHMKGETTDDV